MEDAYPNAYTEIYEIVSHMPVHYIKKLPEELFNLLKEKRNQNYEYHINIDKTLNEQEMLMETKAILSNLYRDFWSSPEKKEEILQKEKIERAMYQDELREKYNPDNLFKNRPIVQGNGKIEEAQTSMIQYKKPNFIMIVYYKICNLLKIQK